jgi:NAD(P)-dependent dehydrogenase (short-subunit alcohol dehydrogenase family)
MKIIVTGANSGIGQATAAALAADGHQVVIASRTVAKGQTAAASMDGDVTVQRLDLADLSSVRTFADSIDSVDVLVNNAGVLGLPLTRTADGFESHIGTNHLGHFALTCLLTDRIKDRVISVTSGSYLLARLHLEDLNWHDRQYSWWSAYTESKLANILFIYELARRGVSAYAADPGIATSSITRDAGAIMRLQGKYLHPIVGQSPAQGARSTLQAVSSSEPSGSYFAPRGFLHQWGKPTRLAIAARGRDPHAAQQLWELSAKLTGCDLP